MTRSFARTVLPLALILLAGLASPVAAQEDPLGQDPLDQDAPAPAVRAVAIPVGKTVAVADDPTRFARVLFAPPDEARLTPGRTWDIDMALALRLGRMEPAERWRAIRRNLGLPPDDKRALVVWTEVVDALLSQLGTLPDLTDPGAPGFGLRVAFPGTDPENKRRAEVALTFEAGKTGFEDRLNERVAAAMTGVEGFVNLVFADGTPVEGDWLKVHPGLTVRLKDGEGKEVAAFALKDHPFYCFPSLPADKDLGGDYRLEIAQAGRPGDTANRAGLVIMEPQYVPVRYGVRSRQDLTLTKEAPPEEEMAEILEDVTKKVDFGDAFAGLTNLQGAPASVVSLFQQLAATVPVVNIVAGILPANPGLHFGAVMTKDAGPQVFYSVRFKFRADLPDRGPRFVTRGAVRLQALSAEDAALPARPTYVKVVWLAQTDAARLSLDSRPVRTFPLGLGIGVVPSMSPALYSAGLSYKMFNVAEIYAGVGFRSDKNVPEDPGEPFSKTSFVYGLTVDVEHVLGAIFKAVNRDGN
ncbi:MAG: hypothetical protein KA243_05960 [Candidatus Aminicenantes bacterium]|nr:hypothetical protein [Candidatus Aminicenantes bacterium]NLH77731.1 hypothetical protein [Acidobacteriota bacterium]